MIREFMSSKCGYCLRYHSEATCPGCGAPRTQNTERMPSSSYGEVVAAGGRVRIIWGLGANDMRRVLFDEDGTAYLSMKDQEFRK